MGTGDPRERPAVRRLVEDLAKALGTRLVSVVLYGSAARDDFHDGTSDLNVLIVLADLDPQTLERLSGPLARWERLGQPAPRLFSPGLIAESADVFPIEFLDVRSFHVVLHGQDPFAAWEPDRTHLRLQCERELREKLMRLREGYVACHDRPRELTRLLTDSYTTFTALFRGCLYLLGGRSPRSNEEVVAAFCAQAGLARTGLDDVARLKRGERVDLEPKTIFVRYYDTLTRAVGAVDRFENGGTAQ